jgi:hypothetical protein
MSNVKKSYHFIRVSKNLKADLLVWSQFLEKFNGISYIQDRNCTSNSTTELYTDSAGGGVAKDCGAYYAGKWTYLQWPTYCYHTEMLRDITYLELVPITLSIYLWGYQFINKKVLFHTDNAAVVSILNNTSSKYDRITSLLRPTMYWTLLLNFQFKAKHVFSDDNCIADAISRGQVERFRRLAPPADAYPC